MFYLDIPYYSFGIAATSCNWSYTFGIAATSCNWSQLIGIATLVKDIIGYQYYRITRIINAFQNLPRLAEEIWQVVTVWKTDMYHGNDSESNMSAAVLKKLLMCVTPVIPMFYL